MNKKLLLSFMATGSMCLTFSQITKPILKEAPEVIRTGNEQTIVKNRKLLSPKPGSFAENTPIIVAPANANGNSASISFNSVSGALNDMQDAKYYLFDCDYDGKDNLLVVNLNERSIQQNSVRRLNTNTANAVQQTGESGVTPNVKLSDELYFGEFSPGTGNTFLVHDKRSNQFWHYQHNASNKNIFERPYAILSNWISDAKYATGDFNGDGKSDLLAWDISKNEFHVALHTKNQFASLGEASLQPAGIWLTGWAQSASMNIVTGDFNGDKKDDIAIVHQPTGEWWVALSNGTVFQPGVGYKSGVWLKPWAIGTHHKIIATDVNSDGKCDLVEYNYNEKSFQAVLSNGQYFDYFFKKEYISGTIANPLQVAIGKFNGQGIIVIGHLLLPDAQFLYPRRAASIYLTNYKRL